MSSVETTYHCPHCDWLAEQGLRTGEPPYHGPDTTPRRFAIGDRVTVPGEKCPTCDSHHSITDWTGTVTGFEHPFHAGPADMGKPGPYYRVAMADGALVYGEQELTRVESFEALLTALQPHTYARMAERDRLVEKHGSTYVYKVVDAIHDEIFKLVASGHLEIPRADPDWIAWRIVPAVLAVAHSAEPS